MRPRPITSSVPAALCLGPKPNHLLILRPELCSKPYYLVQTVAQPVKIVAGAELDLGASAGVGFLPRGRLDFRINGVVPTFILPSNTWPVVSLFFRQNMSVQRPCGCTEAAAGCTFDLGSGPCLGLFG